ELRAIALAERARREAHVHRVAVCSAAGCLALGAQEARTAFERAAAGSDLSGAVEVHGTGCLGLCHAGPMVEVRSRVGGQVRLHRYERVTGERAARIVEARLSRGEPASEGAVPEDHPFFARQTRVVLAGSGDVDPERIESCVGAGAYAALLRALTEMTPQEVVAEISASGLRGRGGAGYPTGLKWATVAKAPGARKIVVCNADEGDPGAFMDRRVLEGDPHRVLEGMAIAGHAVGADRGYVYVRGEHPLAIQRLRRAIQQAERLGVLGSRVLDTGFDFRIDLRIGAGAYVCGEETALLASIEGGRGTPRPRPPYPAESGLWGLPTLLNNVETFANVPAIVTRGAGWFAGMGSERSKGTKVFALAGDVVHNGIVEVPMGITLREIVFEIGGGIRNGRRLKAAQTGGPSGGCIPASHLDLPIDYESLLSVGSMMGSGGLVVMDDSTCMVDVARFFMEFCRDESCGKCVPCRAGTVQMHAILERITRGEGVPGDLARLEELAELLRSASLCGLGQGAPSPVLSTLRHFKDEVLAHVLDRRCPAGACRMAPAREPAEAT
ncbi:MAG TPA: NuoF family protein, partial [Anaeromyxobacteraceae bacterium]|nr:NuoF family protein [Anaeromyxobacteraceae bacterium]